MSCFRCGASTTPRENFCAGCSSRSRRRNIGLPGWPTQEVAEGQDLPLLRRVAQAVLGTDFHYQGKIIGGGSVARFMTELEQRFGPFADTTITQTPDGSFDLRVDSATGLLQVVSALVAIVNEGDEGAHLAMSVGMGLLAGLGIPFMPSMEADEAPAPGHGTYLPAGHVPSARELARRLYDLEQPLPLRFDFPEEAEVRRILEDVLATGRVSGVRVEPFVPTEFDQAVAQSFGKSAELAFFQSTSDPTIVVWVADAMSLRDLLEGIVSYWRAIRTRNVVLANAAGVLVESILETIGFFWEGA